MGSYFQGFSSDKRGTQQVEITSSSGDKIKKADTEALKDNKLSKFSNSFAYTLKFI